MVPALGRVASSQELPQFFRLLADETRLMIVRLLTLTDLRAGEIGQSLHLPSNAVSYHLKQLSALGLLRDHRSSADARDVYYHLDLDRLQALYTAAGDSLYPGLSSLSSMPRGSRLTDTPAQALMTGSTRWTEDVNTPGLHDAHEERAAHVSRRLRVLFLCTHNSARSQIAEALLRHLGGDQVESFSAGSMPTQVHPDAITVLQELGVATSSLEAKSLDQFVGEPFDYIITVCDRVRDVCPAFFGDPAQIHWSFSDPAVVEDPSQRLAAFRQVAREIQTRIRYLLVLPHPATGEWIRIR